MDTEHVGAPSSWHMPAKGVCVAEVGWSSAHALRFSTEPTRIPWCTTPDIRTMSPTLRTSGQMHVPRPSCAYTLRVLGFTESCKHLDAGVTVLPTTHLNE